MIPRERSCLVVITKNNHVRKLEDIQQDVDTLHELYGNNEAKHFIEVILGDTIIVDDINTVEFALATGELSDYISKNIPSAHEIKSDGDGNTILLPFHNVNEEDNKKTKVRSKNTHLTPKKKKRK